MGPPKAVQGPPPCLPNGATGPFKDSPRAFGGALGAPSPPPRAPQEHVRTRTPPKLPQEAPRDAQRPPKANPKDPKSLTRDPKGSPSAAERRPEASKETRSILVKPRKKRPTTTTPKTKGGTWIPILAKRRPANIILVLFCKWPHLGCMGVALKVQSAGTFSTKASPRRTLEGNRGAQGRGKATEGSPYGPTSPPDGPPRKPRQFLTDLVSGPCGHWGGAWT